MVVGYINVAEVALSDMSVISCCQRETCVRRKWWSTSLPATQAILPALLSRLVEEACQTGVTRTPKPSRQMSPGTSHIDPNLFPHACMVCGWTDERWCPHQTCFAGPLQSVHTLWPAVFTLPLTLTAALLSFRGRAAGWLRPRLYVKGLQRSGHQPSRCCWQQGRQRQPPVGRLRQQLCSLAQHRPRQRGGVTQSTAEMVTPHETLQRGETSRKTH